MDPDDCNRGHSQDRGGGYTIISKDLLGCATARNKGTCGNRLNIRRDALEASVLTRDTRILAIG